jgi:chromosome condensin MukBEF ATPase and DNA-binding subunit MukB
MSDKLQEIKRFVSMAQLGFKKSSDDDLYYLRKGDIEWLIKQAEKVDELEQSLNDSVEMTEQFLSDKHFYMDELKKAQSKIERYEKALKEIAYELWNEPTVIAEQALKG